MRIAILGLGAVGTAAARFLAADGHQVIGFEQFQLDHDRGSSYGGSRVIRPVYPDPLYATLMQSAYPLWRALERYSGETLLVQCGGFFFGPEGHPEMTAAEAALTEVGFPYERFSAAEAARRLPQFRLLDSEYGFLEPQSGLLRASRCVLANARGARACGAELREGARVDAIEPRASEVRLLADGEWRSFDRVVMTAGPWAGSLLAPFVELPLRVTRQQYAHFRVEGDRTRYSPAAFPVWIDMAERFYGFPEHGEIPGAKAALHVPGPPIAPDGPDRTPGAAENEILRRYLRRRLPEISGEVTYSKVCLYTNTPDEDFIVDRLPAEPRVVLVAGLSGHGFKFTVLLGQIAAALASDRDPGCDLARFALARFHADGPGIVGRTLEQPES